MSYENYRVEILPTDQISKGTRYREDYKDVHVLARGIKEKGLINPITVYEHSAGGDGTGYLLLAGGRRLAAHAILKRTEIPCRIYDKELSDLEIRSIELEENLNREDLEYHEEIKLKKEIHELQIALYGPKTSTNPDASGHSMRDTANLLKTTPATLSRDLKIASAMERFPELQWTKCKNKQEASKLIDKIQGSIFRMEVAKQVEKKLGTGDKLKKGLFDAYIVDDFLTRSSELPDEHFNLVEIDPPYGINLTNIKKGDTCDGYNEVDAGDYPKFIQSTLEISFRKMAANSWLILWFGFDPWFPLMQKWLIEAGFSTTGLVGLWVKGQSADGEDCVTANAGQSHQPNTRLANAYETFFYAWKGSPTLARPGSSNVFGYKPIFAGKKSHPTERPLELMSDVLTTFAVEGSKVLVPFAGSGATLISAIQNKMFPTGFDLNQAYKDSYVIKVDELF